MWHDNRKVIWVEFLYLTWWFPDLLGNGLAIAFVLLVAREAAIGCEAFGALVFVLGLGANLALLHNNVV